MAKARVRGVYSTALTKLLLDHEFDIVQPSATIKERLGLKENSDSPDLDIYDSPDLQGVQALGKTKLVNKFCSILQSRLEDVIIRMWPVTVDGIYRGLIMGTEPKTHSVPVDIGSAVGKLNNKKVSSPNLKAPQARFRVRKLGEKLIPPNWSILWRTTAADQPSNKLKEEVISLIKEGRDVMEQAETAEAPAMLREGKSFANAEFPALSKKQLDKIRESIVPTIDGHHYYKACGRHISLALDMAEKLLERGSSIKEVVALFEQTVEREFPTVGSVVGIEHVKLDGKVFHIGARGLNLIEAFDRNRSSLRLSRVFRKKGIYDGLEIPKEPGDRAITEAKLGEWYYKTQYFSSDGQLKGTYFNLNTPIELYPHHIRYVDLEVDVCVWSDGRIRTLDEEKLEEATENGLVTEKLVKIVKEKLRELMKNLRACASL